MSRLMVLGLGNILHQDKGLGVYALRDLHKLGWPERVSFADESRLYRQDFSLQGFEFLVVLDAMKNGGEPGTRFRFTADDLMENRTSLDAPMLLKTLTLSELMGQYLEVVFMGLEPEEVNFEVCLTPTLQEAYPDFLRAVRSEMECILGRMGIDCPRPAHEVWWC